MSEVLKLAKRRFWISRETGFPVTPAEGQKHEYMKPPPGRKVMLLKNPCLVTHLKNRINFYMVAEAKLGRVAIMSDGERTLYVWLGDVGDTYPLVRTTSPYPSTTEEEAKENFFKRRGGDIEVNSVIGFKLRDFMNMPAVAVHTA